MPDTPTVLHYAAFTDAGAGGNPAGVVLDAGELDAAARLALAAELGYSESAFAEPGAEADEFRVQYFSPRAEVPFCGHATIATAVALAERRGPGSVRFATRVGEIGLETREGPEGLTATLTSVPTHTRPARPEVLAAALDALRWRAADLDPRYPAHVAYAGNDHLVLAAGTRERLRRLDYDFDALGALMAAQDWITVHLVHAHSTTEFAARDPFPPGGVVEDPATGAAAAAFGGYLRALGLVDPPARVTIQQGEDMGRPSRLLVDIPADDDRVRVTGAASEQR